MNTARPVRHIGDGHRYNRDLRNKYYPRIHLCNEVLTISGKRPYMSNLHNRQAMEDTNKTPIYHITHVNNLRAIAEASALLSDDQMEEGEDHVAIGYGHITARRMSLPVSCAPGTTVGQYVPFYFCPRSIMLYIALYGLGRIQLTSATNESFSSCR